jgi:hypothetical protein
MTTPNIGGDKDTQKKKGDLKVDPKDVNRIKDITFFEGPKKAKESNIEKAKEITAQVSKSTYKTVEDAKPGVRKKLNKFRNSTFGTVAEGLALGAVLIGGSYLVVKSGKKWNKKRKAKKAAAIGNTSTDTPLADEILGED